MNLYVIVTITLRDLHEFRDTEETCVMHYLMDKQP